jgi:acetyl-CoA synthetase
MGEIVWRPTADLMAEANVTRLMRRHGIAHVRDLRTRSVTDPDWFWDAVVRDLGIAFHTPYHTVRDTSAGIPWTTWFGGGSLNITANCLARHVDGGRGDHVALVAEREDGTRTRHTYRELAALVDRCTAALRAAGVVPGDRVAAYMPMTAEVVIQMLATFQVGAIFVPVFSGYAAPALAERLRHAEVTLLFTTDVARRRAGAIPVKAQADAALAEAPSVRRVVVVRHENGEIPWTDDRDVSWNAFLGTGTDASTTWRAAMDPALILYTSGTSGRPKGTVHSHAGSLVQIAKETGYAFDLRPEDRFFWLTDIGWMMGPWTIVGGLFHGATVVLYDGAFDWPAPTRLWSLLADLRITVFGISPTAVRMAMRQGIVPATAFDLSSLRILGSTGEPWDEASWTWCFEHVGGRRCPIINISGGTDIIGCFLSPLPIDPLKPMTLVGPGLGMAVDVWNEAGEPVRGEVGYLVCTEPAPSMTRGLWNDPARYLESYWSTWPDVWNHGDWARIDEDGCWFLQGRADDTLKVAGRRIGPAEVEGALIETGKVSEAAAIGVPHEIKGETIVCYAVLKPGIEPGDGLREELRGAVVARLGKIDRPDAVHFVADLPKTRSAKIVRRLVRAVHLGATDLGDLSSLQNPESLEAIRRATRAGP